MSDFTENPSDRVEYSQTGGDLSGEHLQEDSAEDTDSDKIFYPDESELLPGDTVMLQYVSAKTDQPLQIIKGLEQADQSTAIIAGGIPAPPVPRKTVNAQAAQPATQAETDEGAVVFVEPFGFMVWP